MLKRWAANIGAVLAWLLVCGLALVVLAVAANLVQVFLVITMVVDKYAIRFWVQLFYIFGGLLWLGFFIFMEHLMFNPSSRAGLLVPRTLYICGLEIIAIALMQLGLDAYGTIGWFDILLVAVELIVGGGMLWFARRTRRALRVPHARLNS